jgi:hypothetical protein
MHFEVRIGSRQTLPTGIQFTRSVVLYAALSTVKHEWVASTATESEEPYADLSIKRSRSWTNKRTGVCASAMEKEDERMKSRSGWLTARIMDLIAEIRRSGRCLKTITSRLRVSR